MAPDIGRNCLAGLTNTTVSHSDQVENRGIAGTTAAQWAARHNCETDSSSQCCHLGNDRVAHFHHTHTHVLFCGWKLIITK